MWGCYRDPAGNGFGNGNRKLFITFDGLNMYELDSSTLRATAVCSRDIYTQRVLNGFF